MTLTKMSKSKGNVITPDEIVYGVYDLSCDYFFQDENFNIVDHTKVHIWRDEAGDGNYYTGKRFGNQPVFLCIRDREKATTKWTIPVLLEGKTQHEYLTNFWLILFKKYPEFWLEEARRGEPILVGPSKDKGYYILVKENFKIGKKIEPTRYN